MAPVLIAPVTGSSSKSSDGISTLPNELLLLCFEHLDTQDLFNLQRATRFFRQLIHRQPKLVARLFYTREAEDPDRYYWIDVTRKAIFHCAQDPLHLGKPQNDEKQLRLRKTTHPRQLTHSGKDIPMSRLLTHTTINPFVLKALPYGRQDPIYRAYSRYELGVDCELRVLPTGWGWVTSAKYFECGPADARSCLDMYLTMPPVNSVWLHVEHYGRRYSLRNETGLTVRDVLVAFKKWWLDGLVGEAWPMVCLRDVFSLTTDEMEEIAITGKRKFLYGWEGCVPRWPGFLSDEQHDELVAGWRADGY